MKKETRFINDSIEVFISNDGKEFLDEKECIDHEAQCKQLEREKALNRIKFNASDFEWESIANVMKDPVYHWYKISNRVDLEEFCECFKYYTRSLVDVNKVERYIQYPDYICLVDYLNGAEESSYTSLSYLVKRTKLFLKQFDLDQDGKIMLGGIING